MQMEVLGVRVSADCCLAWVDFVSQLRVLQSIAVRGGGHRGRTTVGQARPPVSSSEGRLQLLAVQLPCRRSRSCSREEHLRWI